MESDESKKLHEKETLRIKQAYWKKRKILINWK